MNFYQSFKKCQHCHSRHQKTTSDLLRINLKDKLRFINKQPLEGVKVYNLYFILYVLQHSRWTWHATSLPARSRRAIRATIRPERRLGYTFLISYRLLTPSIPDLEIKRKKEEGEEDSKMEEPVNENVAKKGTLVPVSGESHVLCEVTAVGVYPTLQITDARCLRKCSRN